MYYVTTPDKVIEEVIASTWEVKSGGALVFCKKGKVVAAYAPGAWSTFVEEDN